MTIVALEEMRVVGFVAFIRHVAGSRPPSKRPATTKAPASGGRNDRMSRIEARIAAAGVLFALILSTSCSSSGNSGVASPTAVAVGTSITAPIAAAASPSSAAAVPAMAPPTQAPTTPAPTTPPPPPTPPPAPTKTVAPPPPTANTCGAPANPWGYNFCSGGFITAPPSNFCSYFNCIASFSNGRGYVMECGDLTFGKSGGISGSCSGHGGNYRALYAP